MFTEAVPHEDYALEYLQWIQYYDEILIIHCSRHLSETYATAVNVNAEFGDPIKSKVEVIDSGLCSMSLGMVVIAAAKAMAKGKSLEEIIDVVTGIQQKNEVIPCYSHVKIPQKK